MEELRGGEVSDGLRAEVPVLAAGGDDPGGGRLVAHPVVWQPGVDTARRVRGQLSLSDNLTISQSHNLTI